MRRRLSLLILALATASGCVYFNTFFYARQYYDQAEKIRTEAQDDVTPARALDLYEQSMKKCAKVLTEYEGSRWVDDALLLMGKCALQRGEFATALRKFEELVEFYPESNLLAEANLHAGVAHLRQDEPLKAIRAFEGTLADSKNDELHGTAMFFLANARLRMRDSTAALETYESFVREYRKHESVKPATERIAELYLAMGEPQRAREAYESIRSDPVLEWKEHKQRRLAVGRCLRLEGRPEEAAVEYERLLREVADVRDSAEIFVELADLEKEQGNDTLAVERFAEVATRFPRTPGAALALYERGVLLFENFHELEAARLSFDSVAVHSPAIAQAELARERAEVLARRMALDDRLGTSLQRLAAAATEPDPVDVETPPDGGSDAQPSPPAAPAEAPADSAGAAAAADGAGVSVDADSSAAEAGPADSAGAIAADTTEAAAPSPQPRTPRARPTLRRPVEEAPRRANAKRTVADVADADTVAAAPGPADESEPATDAAPVVEASDAESASVEAEPSISGRDYLGSLSLEQRRAIFARADSSARAELAETFLQIGELELLDLQRTEEGLAAYQTVVDEFADTHVAPQALLAVAWIYEHRLQRRDESEAIYWRILEDYGTNRVARGAALALGMEIVLPEEPQIDMLALEPHEIPPPPPPRRPPGRSAVATEAEPGAPRPSDLPPVPGFETPGDAVMLPGSAPADSAAQEEEFDPLAPRALRLATPFYPPEAAAHGIRGSVKIELTISPSGQIEKHRIVSSDDEMLDGAAVEAALRSVYTPPRGEKNTLVVTFDFPPGS